MNDKILRQTVGAMYELSDRYHSDVEPFAFATVPQVFNFTRAIPYVSDIASCDRQECLKRPRIGALGGDCDDKTIFAGAALSGLGVPWRIATTSFKPSGEMQHTYPEFWNRGDWISFDATYPQNELGVERPYTKKLIWKNPMRLIDRRGYSTLEGGFGDLIDVIPGAGVAKGVLGALGGLGDFLKDLPLIGGLFKGKTQHLPTDEVNNRVQAFQSNIDKLYVALDADGKKMLHDLVQSFMSDWIVPRWGTWWGGVINRDWQNIKLDPLWSTERYRTYRPIGLALAAILQFEDVERVGESANMMIVDPLQKQVLTPIETYVQKKYGITAEQLTTQVVPVAQTAAFVKGNLMPLALAGVAIGVAIAVFNRGKKRS